MADNMGKVPRPARSPALSHLCCKASQNEGFPGRPNDHVMAIRQVLELVMARSLLLSVVYEKIVSK
jgi:hypothetical protein